MEGGNEVVISIESESKSGEEVVSICSSNSNSSSSGRQRRCVFKLKQSEEMLFTVINFGKAEKAKTGEGDYCRWQVAVNGRTLEQS